MPHAHILLFLHEQNKYPSAVAINRIISTKIPDELIDPHYYKAVQSFMMHDPCGSARNYSPCMQNGRCTKHFSKNVIQSTVIDEDGYPIYGMMVELSRKMLLTWTIGMGDCIINFYLFNFVH